jgi:predicted ester cyclase
MDRLEGVLRSNRIEHAPSVPSGMAGARQLTAAYFTAFPDIHFATDDLITEGDQVVAHLTATGSHWRASMAFHPLGRRLPFAFEACRHQDGKSAELWSQEDSFGACTSLA